MSIEVILILVLLCVLVISMAWTMFIGAPWVPTSMKTVHTMLDLATVGPNDILYDLGCGDGRTVITAARKYGAKAVGIEIDPLRYFWCQFLITILRLRKQVKIVYGNFFNKDLSEATVITCYLLQETNDKLVNKFKKELHPGTRVVSNTFSFYQLQYVTHNGRATVYTIPNTTTTSK